MAAEKSFEKKVRTYLEQQGAWILKTWGGGMQRTGVPDLLVCLNGVFCGIELKASKGKATDLQKWNISQINAAGGLGVVLYPEGFEQFKKIVKGVMQCDFLTAELNALKAANSSTKCDILTGWEPYQTQKPAMP